MSNLHHIEYAPIAFGAPADRAHQQAQPKSATEQKIRSIMRNRSRRNEYLPATLFGDPAWDMLLHLYASELSRQRVTVSGLCVASHAPATTGLRWLKSLETHGLVHRQGDPLDGRRIFVSLTHKSLSAMEAYFASGPDSPASD